MKLKCTTVVLDLDGTISDPSLGIINCVNYALEHHGFPPAPDRVIEKQIGPPLDETFLKLAPGSGPADITSMVKKYRERYADTGFAENTVYQGMPAVLEQIKSAGLNLGVCTSKRRDFAEQILVLFDLAKYFSFIDGGDIGITKQSQLASLIESGAIDSEAIMVGDREIDINSAKGNGLRSVGVLWGFGDYAELSAAGPSCIVETVEELANVVT